MNTLELSNFGLEEIYNIEAQEIDGGFLPVALGVISIVGAGYGAGLAIGQALAYALR